MYKFKTYDYSHDTHKWGIEYSNDPEGDEIVDVEWFETEQQRNHALSNQPGE